MRSLSIPGAGMKPWSSATPTPRPCHRSSSQLQSILLHLRLLPHHCRCSSSSSSSSTFRSSSSSSTSLPSSSSSPPDYFALLHVDRSTPLSSIKASYYSLALQYHPDRTGGLSPSAQQWTDHRFALLTTAWQTLSDPMKRQRYEQDMDLSAVGDAGRIRHWTERHRPPERVEAPEGVRQEMELQRRKGKEG